MIKLLVPLLIMVFSGIFLYLGYSQNDIAEMPLFNQIIWWILFLYGLVRVITIIIKRK